MKHIPLSVNAPLGNIKALERTGYDCIEPSNTDIAAMEEAEFLSAAESLEASRLRCVVIDNPIPCSVSFAAENWELASWEDYLRLSAKRAVRLGAKYWCFGNGTSRALPGEAEADARVMENFRAAVLLCADIASEHGISVIVEPLGPSVTNYLTSVAETAEYVRGLGRENIFTMVDYRWEHEQDRPISELYDNAELIVHAHIDSPATDYKRQKIRRVPSAADGVDYSGFFDFVKSGAFRGVMSIEANSFDDYEADLASALCFYARYGIAPESGEREET